MPLALCVRARRQGTRRATIDFVATQRLRRSIALSGVCGICRSLRIPQCCHPDASEASGGLALRPDLRIPRTDCRNRSPLTATNRVSRCGTTSRSWLRMCVSCTRHPNGAHDAHDNHPNHYHHRVSAVGRHRRVCVTSPRGRAPREGTRVAPASADRHPGPHRSVVAKGGAADAMDVTDARDDRGHSRLR
jgi:hypothetical protein